MQAKVVKPDEEHFLIVEDDKGRNIVPLRDLAYSLGRGKDCDIRVSSQFVSRHHATLIRGQYESGQAYYQIIDGDRQGRPSANGLLINGNKVASYILKSGDKVVLGPQAFIIYQYRQYDKFPTLPSGDPFDITLIDPAMVDEDESEDTNIYKD